MYYFEWPLLQSSLVDININQNYTLLIEDDIPLLYVTKSLNQYYLHYLIDEDADTQRRRYLYLPITNMKIRALVTRGLSLIDCLKSDDLIIYDLGKEDNLLFKASIKYKDISTEALPESDSYLPPVSDNVIDILFGKDNNKELVFILEGEKVRNHIIPFHDLSSYLLNTQQVVTDSTSYYCEENDITSPINAELGVIATNAASFAINTKTVDKTVVKAIGEIIPKYTREFINFNDKDIYEILDTLPTKLSQSLFSYYKFIFKNDYETIIKVKNNSLYLNKEYVKKIKKNINSANYVREETITSKGYLLGGNLKTNSFYFVSSDANKTIKGHFSEEYLKTHPSETLTLSESQLWKAKFKMSIQYKFSEFKKIYELIELEQISTK